MNHNEQYNIFVWLSFKGITNNQSKQQQSIPNHDAMTDFAVAPSFLSQFEAIESVADAAAVAAALDSLTKLGLVCKTDRGLFVACDNIEIHKHHVHLKQQ